MNQPLVSILINAYNEERYIGAAIESAIAQTYDSIEIIILDDQSTDRTAEIVKNYNDPRVRYIRSDKRLGLTDGRNALLAAAKGEYLTYLDADDIYEPTKVEAEAKFLQEHHEYAGVYCNLAYFYDGEPEKSYHHRFTFYSGDDVFPQLLDRMFITNTAFMFRREVYEKLGPYRKDLGLVEDWEFFLRMTYAGYKIGYINKDLVHYRLRWDSHTNFAKLAALKESAVHIFEDLKSRMPETDRKKYDIDHHIADRKETWLISLFSIGEKKKATEIYREIKPYMNLKKRIAMSGLAVMPTPLARFLLEKAWNMRKKGLFIPA
jgi:glycosyltransferase involved in cell wall biosynthesis